MILLIFPICDRIELLPYFFRYYSTIGVTKFVCGLYNGKNSPYFQEIANYQSLYDLEMRPTFTCAFEQYNPVREMRGLNRIREEFATKCDWYCIADLDEFHFFGGKSIPQVIQQAERSGYEAVHGLLSDRIAIDGIFPEIDLEQALDTIFPLACNLSKCSGACCHKVVLAKTNVKIGPGHHHTKATTWRNAAEVHHFKWQKGVYEVIEDRFRRYTKQEMRWARIQLPAALQLIHRGGVSLDNPKLRITMAPRLGI
jgi:hypothetical protein